MDIFSILSLIGGLAMFLYGMNAMGQGLEKLSGSRLEKILEKMTSNPFKGIALGALECKSTMRAILAGFDDAFHCVGAVVEICRNMRTECIYITLRPWRFYRPMPHRDTRNGVARTVNLRLFTDVSRLCQVAMRSTATSTGL